MDLPPVMRPPSSVVIHGQRTRLAAGRGVRLDWLGEQGAVIGRAIILLALDQPRYELWSFEVYSPYRRQGYGRSILRSLAESFRPLWLRVDKTNHPARRLYEQAGFRTIAEHDEDIEMEIGYPEVLAS